MQYPNITTATFLRRPNRFLAEVLLEGATDPILVHVKNTGRCRELLIPGTTVYLVRGDNPARKTLYDLVAVQKGSLLINMDSQAPNQVIGEALRAGTLFPNPLLIQAEKKDGDSRLDFYVEYLPSDSGEPHRAFLEVKGCTLEVDGVALFPDAPTDRGVKHVRHLADLVSKGYEAVLIIVIQMDTIRCFRPNDQTHPEFGDALREAATAGVRIRAFSCQVTPDTLTLWQEIPVEL